MPFQITLWTPVDNQKIVGSHCSYGFFRHHGLYRWSATKVLLQKKIMWTPWIGHHGPLGVRGPPLEKPWSRASRNFHFFGNTKSTFFLSPSTARHSVRLTCCWVLSHSAFSADQLQLGVGANLDPLHNKALSWSSSSKLCRRDHPAFCARGPRGKIDRSWDLISINRSERLL